MHSSTQEIIAGKWHAVKGRIWQKWGEVTHDEYARSRGRREELSGVLQQRIGYGRYLAERGGNKWIDEDERTRNL